MGIPESQLATWSNRGAIDASQKTHESIRKALSTSRWIPSDKQFDVYLQGSYKNYTNTRGNSDVDVVVQLNSVYQYDINALSAADRFWFEASSTKSPYGWPEFYSAVYQTLVDYYGTAAVFAGKKAIKVNVPHLLTADVVVCLEYRRYQRFTNHLNAGDYIEGMTFWVPAEQRWVVNYPKQHYDNGNAKQTATRDWYKPTIRVFKNMRNYLTDNNQLPSGTACSYFIECLLYNVPSAHYAVSYQATIVQSLNWLVQQTDAQLANFCCQNGVTYLFGPEHEQWEIAKARQFTAALVSLWNGWR